MLGGKFQNLLFKLIGWNHAVINDNYIDESLSCQGGVLEYQYRKDEDAVGLVKDMVGPVEGTVGPVYQST
jgi:hypothetical protein